jgi:arylsulfatase A-like enzyme
MLKPFPALMAIVARVFVLALISTGVQFQGGGRLVAEETGTPRPPNFLIVLLDNLGQEWISCYGSESGRTPHIDRLAAEGVRAEHCYTPPVCGPSRIVMLTGRYPFRTGYTLHHDAGLYGGGGLDPNRDRIFPNVLQAAGFATGIFGKWQINDLYAEPDALRQHGFDTHVVWPDALDVARMDAEKWQRWKQAIAEHDVATTQAMLPLSESRYWNPVVLRDGRREVLKGRYGPDVFQESAVEFLRKNRNRPFLLYCPMVLTHGQSMNEPVVPTPTNPDPNRPLEAIYGDMVSYADKLVGDLVAELERLDLRKNTIVIVATDNGSESRLTARKRGRNVRGGLYTLTEAGIDVALIFNSPGLIPGGRTVPLADFSDIFPTVCDLARVPLPQGRVLDGRSLARYLRGEVGVEPPRDWIFCQYHKRRTVRDQQFKLYSTGELYDVQRDPDESQSLADAGDPAVMAARVRLQATLDLLPPDSPPPFKLRSQSAFKLESDGKL